MMSAANYPDRRSPGGEEPASSCRNRPRPYRKSGQYALKRAIRMLGTRAIDRRTRVGRQLAAWRTDLVGDLGGVDQLSTQQRALVDEAVKLKLLLDSIDGWLFAQPSLVDRRKRALLPVVRERTALVSQLQSLLRDLGLERKAREVPTLASYLVEKRGAGGMAVGKDEVTQVQRT